MAFPKLKITAGIVAGACVAACAAPGLMGAMAFGGLASLGAAFAWNEAALPIIAALMGGGVVYIWATRFKSGSANPTLCQCSLPASQSNGCACRSK